MENEGGGDTWITAREVRRRMGVGQSAFQKLRESGRLTVRQIPGCRAKFLASQVDELVRSAVREADTAPQSA